MDAYLIKIIIGYLKGSLTSKETDDFYNWVHKSPENKKVYFEVKAIYDACIKENKPIDIEESWNRLLVKEKLSRQVSYTGKHLFLSIASAAAITLLFTWTIFKWATPEPVESITQFIGKDGLDVDQLILPDGTEISLGTQTILTYGSDFGKKERTVHLDGEAFFNVKTVENKPFKVITPDHEIEVLGTQFNVTAYSWDSIFTTTLLEGSVRLVSEYLKQPAFLKPDQQYSFNRHNKNVTLTNVDAYQYTKWVKGYYYFPGQDLETICNRLSHIYKTQFTIQAQSLNNKKFTGTFYRGQSIKDILEIINLSIPIKYKIDDFHVTIYE